MAEKIKASKGKSIEDSIMLFLMTTSKFPTIMEHNFKSLH